MPTLHWIGKDKVINHHREVPFRVLEHGYGFSAEQGKAEAPSPAQGPGQARSGNMVVHGDNLEALKALLPRYEGRVKCIYIDPPYNTGNEGWVYNDNVNDPKIRRWLHQVVGKEGEDLSRHDKWLCMMYPRLVLLHKLLAEDGLIFISLDENEVHHFRMMMEEVFGASNYLCTVTWEKRFTRSNNAKLFSTVTENVIVFRRSGMVSQLREQRSEKADSIYNNPDNDPRGPWTSVSYVNPVTKEKRKNLVYTIIAPDGRKVDHPTHAWKYDPTTHAEHVEQNMLWWGMAGENTYPRLKKFKDSLDGMVPVDLWKYEDTGTTDEGSKILAEIIGANKFDNPKPPRLIERCLGFINDPNAIILDSFAGSGTTAHAVLNLNKQDGGGRKFILVEMEDYAETITAERVRRVMQGYGSEKKKVAGTGGAFDYYTLGPRLFDAHHNLNEEVAVEKIREYVWYTETRTDIHEARNDQRKKDTSYLLGKHEDTAYYFVYEKERLTVLDYDTLALLKTKAAHYVIYADNCILPQRFLEEHHITFKKIPRDISRF